MNGDKLKDISMDMTMTAAGTTMAYDITASTAKVDMTMNMTEPTTGMTMDLTYTMNLSDTNKAPQTSLPAGAQEVALEEVMAQLMGGMTPVAP